MQINERLEQVVRIYQNLGIVGGEVDKYDNVRLMKLIYLFFIEYIHFLGIYYGKPECFEDYRFYAYPKGPVEKFVYGNIGIIRTKLKRLTNNLEDIRWEDRLFPNSVKESLGKALKSVKDKYLILDTDAIVYLTHYLLREWRFTPAYSEMTFPFGYKEECEAAAAYEPPVD